MTHAEDAQRFLGEVVTLIADVGTWVRQMRRDGCAYTPVEPARGAVPAAQDEPDGAP